MRRTILLFASTTGYQVREFYEAARALGVDLVLATDRCHVLDNPWGDDAASVRFEDPAPGVAALKARGPFDGILAVGDVPAKIAAEAAEALGLGFHPLEAARAAGDKFLALQKFEAAGLLVPNYRLVGLDADVHAESLATDYPCVLKPLHLSASRGVIRADSPVEFEAAFGRIRTILQPLRRRQPLPDGRGSDASRTDPVLLLSEADADVHAILIEDFIPGTEFAIEGVVTKGELQVLAIFDKPDPLDGPYFEETIYVTPSQATPDLQNRIRETVQRAITGLGLFHGPVHAEARVNDRGVWMLEVAARPIGGLCARVLKFRDAGSDREFGLEELLLRHALGEQVSHAALSPGAHGVMMIPIPRGGVYRGTSGVENALTVPGIEDVVMTAKEGQVLIPLPDGASYLGFIFARTERAFSTYQALHIAHAYLKSYVSEALPVVD